jgi:sortase A
VRWAAALLGIPFVVLAGCADTAAPEPGSAGTTTAPRSVPSSPPAGGSQDPAGTPTPGANRTPTPKATPKAKRPATFRLAIPAIGLTRLRVAAYQGSADDKLGTRIQDLGSAASPRGPAGGVAPGEIGNLIITGHRLTANRPFYRLPAVRNGQHILITAAGLTYDYVVTGTLTISFRSPASKASQSAPVPGRPGVRPTRPMITLSTCATPEDDAAGNFWRDSLGNPEHRIDKIGVLVDIRGP